MFTEFIQCIIPMLQAMNNIRLQSSNSAVEGTLCLCVTTDLPVRDVREGLPENTPFYLCFLQFSFSHTTKKNYNKHWNI